MTREAVKEWVKSYCGWDIVDYQCTISGKDVYEIADSEDFKGCIEAPCIGSPVYIIVDGDTIHRANNEEKKNIQWYLARPATIAELKDIIESNTPPEYVKEAISHLKHVLERPEPTL